MLDYPFIKKSGIKVMEEGFPRLAKKQFQS